MSKVGKASSPDEQHALEVPSLHLSLTRPGINFSPVCLGLLHPWRPITQVRVLPLSWRPGVCLSAFLTS